MKRNRIQRRRPLALAKIRSAVLAVLVLVPLASFAGLEDEFRALKDSRRSFEVVGTICEEVARLQVARRFSSAQYKVVTGIAYGDNKRTIGELDVIVFDLRTREAVEVSEVKCWKNMGGGLKKARDQRERFLTTVRSGIPLNFQSTSDRTQYSLDQFKNVTKFTSMGQKGCVDAGYDSELEYTLEELMGLRARLIQCQARGECAAAS